jgi:hypothetical protein
MSAGGLGLYCILLQNGDRERLAADTRPLVARIAELESKRARLTPTEVSEDGNSMPLNGEAQRCPN